MLQSITKVPAATSDASTRPAMPMAIGETPVPSVLIVNSIIEGEQEKVNIAGKRILSKSSGGKRQKRKTIYSQCGLIWQLARLGAVGL